MPNAKTRTDVLEVSGVLVISGADLVKLSVAVQVMNALLLPVVLGFLFLLARRALTGPYRLNGWYAWVAGALIVVTGAPKIRTPPRAGHAARAIGCVTAARHTLLAC